MYSQILGCLIMGYATGFKTAWFDTSDSRYHRVVYISITSGLCGSITSFSSWMLQCNKNLFLQADLSYGSYFGSYNAGRFMEWLTSMCAGVAVPLMALRFGKFLYEVHAEYDAARAAAAAAAQTPSKLVMGDKLVTPDVAAMTVISTNNTYKVHPPTLCLCLCLSLISILSLCLLLF